MNHPNFVFQNQQNSVFHLNNCDSYVICPPQVQNAFDAASCHFRNFVDEIVPIPTFDKAGYWKQLRTMNSTQKQKMDPQMMKRWVHIEPDLSDHAGWGPNGRRTAQA